MKCVKLLNELICREGIPAKRLAVDWLDVMNDSLVGDTSGIYEYKSCYVRQQVEYPKKRLRVCFVLETENNAFAITKITKPKYTVLICSVLFSPEFRM